MTLYFPLIRFRLMIRRAPLAAAILGVLAPLAAVGQEVEAAKPEPPGLPAGLLFYFEFCEKFWVLVLEDSLLMIS